MATTWSGDTLGPYWTATMATRRVDELKCSLFAKVWWGPPLDVVPDHAARVPQPLISSLAECRAVHLRNIGQRLGIQPYH